MSANQTPQPGVLQRSDSYKTSVKLLEALRRGNGIFIGIGFLLLAALLSLYKHVLLGILSGEIGSVLRAASLIHLTYERIMREEYETSILHRLEELLQKYKLDNLLVESKTSFETVLQSYRLDHVSSDLKKVFLEAWVGYNNLLSLGIKGGYEYLPATKLVELCAEAKSIKILKTWHPEETVWENKLKEAVSRPVHPAQVEFFLCHPDSAILRQRCAGAGERDADEGKRKNERIVRQVYDWIYDKIPCTVSVTFYDAWPGAPVIQIDKSLFVGFFLRGLSSPSSPWFKVEPTSEFGKLLIRQFFFNDREIRRVLDSQEKFEKWFEERGEGQQPPAKPPISIRGTSSLTADDQTKNRGEDRASPPK